ncbi:MAG: DUF4388 domain-containing protein [Acidobacteriota bacterium]
MLVMFLDRSRTEEIARLSHGRLDEVPFAAVLHALALEERTAVLSIQRGPLKKEVFFEDGFVVDCRSNLIHETLGRFMMALGKISAEDLHRTLNVSFERGVRLGEVLQEEGIVTAVELARLLQQNLAKKVLDLFTWRDGSYQIVDEVPATGSPLKMKVPQLVVTGVAKFTSTEEIRRMVDALREAGVFWDHMRQGLLEDLRLSSEQQHLAHLLAQGWGVDEVVAASPIEDQEIFRLLYAFGVLGLIAAAPQRIETGVEAGVEAVPEAAVEMAPAPVSSAEEAAPVTTADEVSSGLSALAEIAAVDPAADDLVPVVAPSTAVVPEFGETDPQPAAEPSEALAQIYLDYRGRDAFDLLGVPETVTMSRLRVAFLAFSERFAPWSFPEAGLADKARDLFLAGAQAFGDLADGERRQALIEGRRSRVESPVTSSMAIETDLLDSEKQFEKGKGEMERGDFEQAVTTLQFAADCDPQNAEYRAELAYCRYLAEPQRLDHAIIELQDVLRLEADCGEANLYLGELLMERDEWQRSEDHLRRANRMLAPDRRPIESLKALAVRRRRG